MNRLQLLRLSPVFAAMALVTSAHADPTIYADASDWQDATQVVATDTFSQYPAGSNFIAVGNFTDPYGISFSDTYQGSSTPYLYVISQSDYLGFGSGNYLLSGPTVDGNISQTTITFPTDYSSFGFDIGTYGNTGVEDITLNTSAGDFSYQVTTPGDTTSFFGFTLGSGVTLNNVVINAPSSANGQAPVLDNIAYGNIAPVNSVPDGANTLALFLLAGGVLVIAHSPKMRRLALARR